MARKMNKILSTTLAGAIAFGAMGCEDETPNLTSVYDGDGQEERETVRFDGQTVTSNFFERLIRNQSPDEYHIFEGRTPSAPATIEDIAQMSTLTSRIYTGINPDKIVEGPSGFKAFIWRQPGEESDLYLICSAGAEAPNRGLALQMDKVCLPVFVDSGVEILANIPNRAEPNSYDVTNPFLEEGPNRHPFEVVAPISDTGIRLILPRAPGYTANPEFEELGPENLQGILTYSPAHDEPRLLQVFPQGLSSAVECLNQGGTPYAAYNGTHQVGETAEQAVSIFGSYGDTAADVCVVSFGLDGTLDGEQMLTNMQAYEPGVEAAYRLVFAAQRSLEEQGRSSRHPHAQ